MLYAEMVTVGGMLICASPGVEAEPTTICSLQTQFGHSL